MPRILLADDHALVRKGLRDCLELMPDAPTVIEAQSLDGAVSSLERDPVVDLVILDLRMPGMNGLQGLDVVRTRWPGIPVVIMSGSIDCTDILGALDRGAAGYIPKTLELSAIQSAVGLVLSGEHYVPRVLLGTLTEARAAPEIPAVPGVTRREGEVWKFLSKEIGRLLGLQEVTIKLHVRALLKKLGVTNRTQASTLFLRAHAAL